MQRQGYWLISTASAGRSLRYGAGMGALLAVALLHAATQVSAQETWDTQPMSFGSAQQQSGGKWYSKYIPWKKSNDAAQFKMPPKREITRLEEPSDEVKEEGQLSFARLSERRGQPEQAQAIYEAFIAKHPDNPLPFHRLGVLAARQGDFKKCDSYLSRAFHLDGDNPDLLADIGYSMYLRGLLPDAETFYRRALEVDRDHEAASNNLAILLAETGRDTESLAIFKRVNDAAKAYANQGYVLAQTGELDQAKKYFNHALTLDPTLKQAAQSMLQLAEYQQQIRTAPDMTRDRAPDQLAGTTQPPNDPTPVAVAKPRQTESEIASLVSIEDREPARISPQPAVPSAAEKLAAFSPPPVMIEDSGPAAVPQTPSAKLAYEPAQDLSVRDKSRTSPIKNSRRPQVIRATKQDDSPPPAPAQQVTTWPDSQPVTALSQLTRDRAAPAANPASSIFTTRISDIGFSEPLPLPPTQTVPESSMPIAQQGARTQWGLNPVRPAIMDFGAEQPAWGHSIAPPQQFGSDSGQRN